MRVRVRVYGFIAVVIFVELLTLHGYGVVIMTHRNVRVLLQVVVKLLSVGEDPTKAELVRVAIRVAVRVAVSIVLFGHTATTGCTTVHQDQALLSTAIFLLCD